MLQVATERGEPRKVAEEDLADFRVEDTDSENKQKLQGFLNSRHYNSAIFFIKLLHEQQRGVPVDLAQKAYIGLLDQRLEQEDYTSTAKQVIQEVRESDIVSKDFINFLEQSFYNKIIHRALREQRVSQAMFMLRVAKNEKVPIPISLIETVYAQILSQQSKKWDSQERPQSQIATGLSNIVKQMQEHGISQDRIQAITSEYL